MIDGDVIIFNATTFKDTTDVTDVKTDIRGDAESGRFVFVSVDDQPRQEITSAASSAPSASVILSTATTAATYRVGEFEQQHAQQQAAATGEPEPQLELRLRAPNWPVLGAGTLPEGAARPCHLARVCGPRARPWGGAAAGARRRASQAAPTQKGM